MAHAVHYSGSSTGTQLSLLQGLITMMMMVIQKSYFKTLQFLFLIIVLLVSVFKSMILENVYTIIKRMALKMSLHY